MTINIHCVLSDELIASFLCPSFKRLILTQHMAFILKLRKIVLEKVINMIRLTLLSFAKKKYRGGGQIAPQQEYN